MGISRSPDGVMVPGEFSVGGTPEEMFQFGMPFLGLLAPTSGKQFWCDRVNGDDSTGNGSPEKPFQSLSHAYASCTDGAGDVVVIVSNKASTAGTQRTVVDAVPGAGMTWAKNRTHLIGACAPSVMGQRAGVRCLAADVLTTDMFTVSGGNCIFQNIQFFHGHEGEVAQRAVVVSGARNFWINCWFAGIGHAIPAARADARSLAMLAGADENTFYRCVIGNNTIGVGDGTEVAAQLEFAAAAECKRNSFIDCEFLIWAVTTYPKLVLAGASGIWGRQMFDRCKFIAETNLSGASAPATAILNSSTIGVMHVIDPYVAGCTKISTGTGVLTNGVVPTGATSGLAVNPA